MRAISQHKHMNNLDNIREELMTVLTSIGVKKDILIVVKDQLPYVKTCIESIKQHTKNYELYIWDNASRQDTKEYLESLGAKCLIRSEENCGFSTPNNRLAAFTESPYLILLNSDVKVCYGAWDEVMIGWLKTHPDVKQVGCAGSTLNEEFKGGTVGFGYDIDYIPGWAFCISRETYNQFGLFDDTNLQFAYCEDADLSLRLKEDGHKIYALYADLVVHYENKTMTEINQNSEFLKWFSEIFEKNHSYMRKRWQGKGIVLNECNPK